MSTRWQAYASSRRVVAALWVLAAVAVTVTFASWLTDLTAPGMPWQQPRSMADFRDTIWGPGSYLLDGGNPYDPDRYLALHPWAQEFDPYAPAWLLLSATLSLLPFEVAAGAYLVLGAVLAVAMLRVLFSWAAPDLTRVGVPAGLLFLTIWSPGRYALENGGTLLVFFGWVLTMRFLIGDDITVRSASLRPTTWCAGGDWLGAVGLALALLKPQFGLPLVVVMLAMRRWGAVWRGVAVLTVASVPVVVACSVSSGGFGAFLDSISRLVAYANSPDASTGLTSPNNGRTDLLGLLARFGGHIPPAWASLVVAALTAVFAAFVMARCADPVTATAGVGSATLLGLVHQPYDAVILLVPAVLGLGRLATHGRFARPDLAVWLLTLVPVVHLHRVSTLLPWLSRPHAELLDATALAAGLVVATLIAATCAKDLRTPVSSRRPRA